MQNNSLRQAQELTKAVKVAQTVKANVLGSEVSMGMFLGQVPKLPAISVSFDNSLGGAIQRYIFGDPTTMIAQLIDTIPGGVLNPTAIMGQAGLVTPNKNFFFSVGVIFGSINYQTSSTPNQFVQPFVTYITNMAGELTKETINTASATRNTANENTLLTITGQYYLDVHRGIAIDVLAGESVTLTFSPSAYTV